MTIATGADIEEAGLAGAEVNTFSADIMLYAPYWRIRESPYGMPPIERALLPIVSGLQKQEFQLDYFTEGTTPAVYISPGDTAITPTQIGELQNALNAIAGDPAYHLKTIVLPPNSKVEPQRPIDLSDSFDYLVMNQVLMAFDVQPQELGIVPDVGSTSVGPSASGIKFAGQEKRSIKSRTSAKPLLKWICDIFNYVLQDICQQPDMQFQFEGLADEEDKQVITSLGIEQLQNGVASVDEIRERLDLPPWGLRETSGPIVMTQQGPVMFEDAQMLLQMAMQGQQQQGGSSSSSGSKKKTTSKQPTAKPKRGASPTRPNGSHPAPVTSSKPSVSTPAHAAATGAMSVQRPQRGKTGGSASRTQVAGSRKRGDGLAPTQGRMRNKAIAAELDSLKRHIRKGRLISTWKPEHITNEMLARIAEDTAKGVLLDVAVERAQAVALKEDAKEREAADWRRFFTENEPHVGWEGGAGGGNFEDPEDVEGHDDDDEDDDKSDKFVAKASEWPGWEHDLGLVGGYKEAISQAFTDAEVKGAQLRKDAASGNLSVTRNTLMGLISDQVKAVFASTMDELWTKAWNLGYDSANKLLGTAGSNELALQGFLGTEGAHWVEQVSRTGLGNSGSRSEMIARTEVARAMNAAAIQCYRDNGVSHKHLLVAPDDVCDICVTAKNAGIIPLDTPFPKGGIAGPMHVQCRCIPAPAGIERKPPQAHIGKTMVHAYNRDPESGAGNCWCGHAESAHSEAEEDESRLGWLLLRAKDEDGKYRFLLQQHTDGTWGMPGGKMHVGEDPWNAAYRETTEEIGDLPNLQVARTFHHVEGDIQVYLYLCDCEYFQPKFNGSTPEETQGAAWFRKGEIGHLDLTPKFREDWEKGIRLKQNVTKSFQDDGEPCRESLGVDGTAGDLQDVPHSFRAAGDGGYCIACGLAHSAPVHKSLQNIRNETGEWLVRDDRMGAGLGARWPYPKRPNMDVPENNRPGGGQADGEMGAVEPPNQQNDLSGEIGNTRLYPRGSRDSEFPQRRKPAPPAKEFPYGPTEGTEPQGGISSGPGRGAQIVPGGRKGTVPMTGVRGPGEPHAEVPRTDDPETYDPADAVVRWDPERMSNVYEKGRAEDHSDPNPVDPHHVYLLMSGNFPPEAIQWVKRATWQGPVNIPWESIDTDSVESWAASHQPEKVKEFEDKIRAHKGDVAPSILIQDNDSPKAICIDGHHRAIARKNLKMPVLAYLGTIDPKDRKAAEETHSSQIHQGADPQNKAGDRVMVSKASVNYRPGSPFRNCGNCVMFHQDHSCDLVKGKIMPGDVCDRWEAK